MVTQEQGKLFMAYADLEVAKKRAPTDKHIELAMEQLEMDMGVPGMCYTRKEILRGAPPPEEGEEEPHGVERGDTVTCHAAGFLQQGNNNFWSTRTRRRAARSTGTCRSAFSSTAPACFFRATASCTLLSSFTDFS